jgi:hypothetical protein
LNPWSAELSSDGGGDVGSDCDGVDVDLGPGEKDGVRARGVSVSGGVEATENFKILQSSNLMYIIRFFWDLRIKCILWIK